VDGRTIRGVTLLVKATSGRQDALQEVAEAVQALTALWPSQQPEEPRPPAVFSCMSGSSLQVGWLVPVAAEGRTAGVALNMSAGRDIVTLFWFA